MPVLKEIESQVETLGKVYEFALGDHLNDIVNLIRSAEFLLFVGCGSSYYVGLGASKYHTGIASKPSKAVPGGEILQALRWNVPDVPGKKVAVLISRSGETTEVVKSVSILKDEGFTTVGLTIEDGSSLTKEVDIPIVLPMEERSIVMTASFTGMMLTLQIIVERSSGKVEKNIYEKILSSVKEIFESFKKEAKEFSKFSHYVFLGSGPYEGIARESALKLQEMSLTYTEAYTTLDYRHGPKSLVDENTAIVIFGDGEEERKLAEELEGIGGSVSLRKVLAKDYRDTFAQVMFSQLLGYEIASRKGVDVEAPRHLTKVVKLDG